MKLLSTLTSNSRFWILFGGITVSFFIAGFIQFYVPAGTLQTIRIEQAFGFTSFVFLYIAVLASPFTKLFPNVTFNGQYLHARRAIGVLAFYYACLHVYITFFEQLGGFQGMAYLNPQYSTALWAGAVTLAIMAIMTFTSLDYAVKIMRFKNWKLLHRLVYIAGVALLLHVALIGPHYQNLTITGIITYILIAFLLVLEAMRLLRYMKRSQL